MVPTIPVEEVLEMWELSIEMLQGGIIFAFAALGVYYLIGVITNLSDR